MTYHPVVDSEEIETGMRRAVFLLLHVNADDQIDGYYVPIGEDYKTMLYPFGNLLEDDTMSFWDKLRLNLMKRVYGKEVEPWIVQAGGNLLAK